MGQDSKQKIINKELNDLVDSLNKEMKTDVENAGFNYDLLATHTTVFGENFPRETYSGILFYGRASNGWDEEILDFNMENLEQDQNRPIYKLMKAISSEFHPLSWYSYIAYGNVYKIAPANGGNPKGKLRDAQTRCAKEIFRKEMDFLSPRYVILVTGNTASDTWHDIVEEVFEDLELINELVWHTDWRGNDCTSSLYKSGGTFFIVSDRPESRPIQPHADSIIELIRTAGSMSDSKHLRH